MEAVYADRENAPVSDECKAALKLIETMTLQPEEVGPEDIDEIRKAGVSDEAIVDAATVSAMFNLIDRLADSFYFYQPDDYDAAAQPLLTRGYQFPPPARWFARG